VELRDAFELRVIWNVYDDREEIWQEIEIAVECALGVEET
jgi:hypothetical protein